jgi:hypothetical protein
VPVSEALVVNPRMGLKLVKDGEQVTAITVMAPVKGRDLHVTTVERSKDPQFFGSLLIHAVTQGAGSTAGSFSRRDRERLAEIGFLLPEELISTPIWFTCDLDDLPVDFIPNRDRRPRAPVESVSDLIVAPSLRHFGREGFSTAMRGRLALPNKFNPNRSWLWIESPDVSAPCAYSYSSGVSAALDRLQPGQPPPLLGQTLRQNLFDAGVIGSAAVFRRDRNDREAHTIAAAHELQERRYAVLPGAIPPLQLAAARRYYDDLISEGFLTRGDADWPDRHFSGRDPIGYFFHQQLTDIVSSIAGQRVKPSFSFFASYRTGSVLPAHRDREQCEYALSIQLDYSPVPEHQTQWPLFVQPLNAETAKPLPSALGDAVLYFGREVRHHREHLTNGRYSRHWFFFYVVESFSGSLD